MVNRRWVLRHVLGVGFLNQDPYSYQQPTTPTSEYVYQELITTQVAVLVMKKEVKALVKAMNWVYTKLQRDSFYPEEGDL